MKITLNKQFKSKSKSIVLDRWMDGWVGGLVDVKAVLRIALVEELPGKIG